VPAICADQKSLYSARGLALFPASHRGIRRGGIDRQLSTTRGSQVSTVRAESVRFGSQCDSSPSGCAVPRAGTASPEGAPSGKGRLYDAAVVEAGLRVIGRSGFSLEAR
jgi:hypothetical protein